MEKHPIGNMMQTTMEYLKDMVDVNTVIGEPVRTDDGSTIIPISRVSFGFVAGGAEYTHSSETAVVPAGAEYPFAGGSGAGVSVQPVGFLAVSASGIQMLPALKPTALDRAVDLLPHLMEDVRTLIKNSQPESLRGKDGGNL